MAGRKPKQFCKHGHDTHVVGRDKWNICRECGRIRHRQYYKENTSSISGYNRSKKRLSRYGITVEEYISLLENQNSKCAICKRIQLTKSLAVDHNHKTGKVRGLLCGNCNLALGLLEDNATFLQAGIDYLNLN